MQHQIPLDELGARGGAMAAAVQSCVHCGFCLPTCPTYRVLGQEMDSPRGRIFLMKEVLEGKLPADRAQTHIDRCLGCLACETNCPSGVPYGQLLSSYRALHGPGGPAERRGQSGRAGTAERLRRWLAATTLPYPGRLRWAMRLGRATRWLRPMVPSGLRPMLDLVPPRLPTAAALPPVTPAIGERRGRVALLAGCAQRVLAPEINAAAVRVLARNGVEVVVPPAQGCCGALSWHVGDAPRAIAFARRNLDAFGELCQAAGDGDRSIDALVTTAAGCGSGVHDYPLMLAGSDDQRRAERLAARTVDVSLFLDTLGIRPPPPLERPLRVAYHDACHLLHAQRVSAQPRRLLRQIPGLEVVDIPDADICCGSAGTYNIDQPQIAEQLGRDKAASIVQTGADAVVLGNIGCQIQIQRYLQAAGCPIPVLHTVQLLDRAYRGV